MSGRSAVKAFAGGLRSKLSNLGEISRLFLRTDNGVPRDYRLRVLRSLRGVHPRSCPCCGYQGCFRARGHPPRYDAQCPNCNSAERHRLLKLWLDRQPDAIGQDHTVLHMAPEDHTVAMIRPRVKSHVSADIQPGLADLVLDIEQIELPDESFDLVVCSHVLEHVDDRRALPELLRVLKPGGLALIMTPVVEGWRRTYENEAVSSPADRELHFGQYDHVRYYGADIRERITEAGFELEEFTACEPDVSTYALARGETLFAARRPVAQEVSARLAPAASRPADDPGSIRLPRSA